MENSYLREGLKRGPAITARPVLVAHRLFQTIKEEHTPTNKDSDALAFMVRQTAEKLKAEGKLGPYSARILEIWQEMETLGKELAEDAGA